MQNFEEWFKSNINYYKIKHSGDMKKMETEARSAYDQIKGFTGEPKITREKSTNQKEK